MENESRSALSFDESEPKEWKANLERGSLEIAFKRYDFYIMLLKVWELHGENILEGRNILSKDSEKSKF